jgi:NAD-dependent deacetylase sirtuin 4
MVRISIPTIKAHPEGFLPSALTQLPVKEAAQHLSEFLKAGKGETLVLTGAGVSVDSGIRAYRGKEGHYSNPNYTCVYSTSDVSLLLMRDSPILYHELVEDTPRGELFRCVVPPYV